MQDTHQELLEEIAHREFSRIKLAASDIDGVLRGKYIRKEKFLSSLRSGFGFCNVVFGWDVMDQCYDNTTYTGWHSGYPDALTRIDVDTHRVIPWEDGIDFFLCDFQTNDGKPLSVCPRQTLKKVIQQVEEAGYTARVGFEYEWFNFIESPESLEEKGYRNFKTLTPGMFGYSVLRSGQNASFFQDIMEKLEQFSVPLEGLHTETGPGTFEAAISSSEPLEAADRAILFKWGVKNIAHCHGFLASFMARWNDTLPGCGCHIHQSLLDRDTGTPVFYDQNDKDNISSVMQHYLAGQLYCLPEFAAFYTPTVNSYKRLVEGYWAPTQVTWGMDNRTVFYRVIGSSPASMRIECRGAGADINPYITLAASLASGLYGIKNKLSLTQPPASGSGYAQKDVRSLPKNLGDATRLLASSSLARELLGEEFVEHFVQTRLWEWRQFEQSVTDWEHKRYFEII